MPDTGRFTLPAARPLTGCADDLLTILAPHSGEVLVRGGQFFPEHTRATLAGASFGGSFLKVREIHPGFVMELIHDGRRIVTTRVRDIVTIPRTRLQ